jgi:hypothetical protein
MAPHSTSTSLAVILWETKRRTWKEQGLRANRAYSQRRFRGSKEGSVALILQAAPIIVRELAIELYRWCASMASRPQLLSKAAPCSLAIASSGPCHYNIHHNEDRITRE